MVDGDRFTDGSRQRPVRWYRTRNSLPDAGESECLVQLTKMGFSQSNLENRRNKSSVHMPDWYSKTPVPRPGLQTSSAIALLVVETPTDPDACSILPQFPWTSALIVPGLWRRPYHKHGILFCSRMTRPRLHAFRCSDIT